MSILLSALIVAHNEEENLPACLDHLGFADRAIDLREAGLEQESLAKNIRRIFSRFYKCYIRRKDIKKAVMVF